MTLMPVFFRAVLFHYRDAGPFCGCDAAILYMIIKLVLFEIKLTAIFLILGCGLFHGSQWYFSGS